MVLISNFPSQWYQYFFCLIIGLFYSFLQTKKYSCGYDNKCDPPAVVWYQKLSLSCTVDCISHKSDCQEADIEPPSFLNIFSPYALLFHIIFAIYISMFQEQNVPIDWVLKRQAIHRLVLDIRIDLYIGVLSLISIIHHGFMTPYVVRHWGQHWLR